MKQTQSLGKTPCKGNYKSLVSSSENVCLQKKDPISPFCNTGDPKVPEYQIKVLRRQVNETHY